jgi:hypothetical protein
VSPLPAQATQADEDDRPLAAIAADIGEMQMMEYDRWIHQKLTRSASKGRGAAQNDSAWIG